MGDRGSIQTDHPVDPKDEGVNRGSVDERRDGVRVYLRSIYERALKARYDLGVRVGDFATKLGLPPFVWRLLMKVWVFSVSYLLYELHHTRPVLAILLGTFFLLDLLTRFMRAAALNAVTITRRQQEEVFKSIGIPIRVVRLEGDRPPESYPMPVQPPPGGGKLH
jgi:hypothetical protein